MKVVKKIWFTGMYGFCGIMLTETELEGERSAYVGVHAGQGEASDAKLIVEGGTRISKEQVEEILRHLSGEDLQNGK